MKDASVNAATPAAFDVERIRDEFPVLNTTMRGKPLVYLDSAVSAQKPRRVIETLRNFYEKEYANIHRGVYELSERATARYEAARETARRFLNAASTREIVFVRGTTEAINLVAATHGRANLEKGDEILISAMEHHSNIVPWQLLCEERGLALRVAPIDDRGELIVEEFEKCLSPRTRIVALVHVSNALGTINPVRELTRQAHRCGAVVLLDGAQAAPHLPIDVRDLDCDFYAFSSHKVFGPTGVGVLYARESLLEALPPYQSGGEMIESVSFEKSTYRDIPERFEAGTPNIAGTIGLGAALDWMTELGHDAIATHEAELLAHATAALEAIPEVRLIGTARHKAGVLSFVLEGVHPHDAGTILDHEGIAVRVGHHCAQPVMERFGVPATIRASLSVYNTREDVDALVAGIAQVLRVFRG
ncbi:MAG: cysteine desulfurase [Deltaproteobacteria bacterium]|nr:MAG: cysteine desulfurase [Deltaproteobacteria bacterium]